MRAARYRAGTAVLQFRLTLQGLSSAEDTLRQIKCNRDFDSAEE